MNQTYSCNHCKTQSRNIRVIFLHIFTTHLHQNCGMSPEDSAVAWEGMAYYHPIEWLFEEN
jgi:hypothetical protein